MPHAKIGVAVSVPLLLSLLMLTPQSTRGAADFADPAFESQWQQDEAVTPNFWGPLDTAKDGDQEPYKEAPDGSRLVQYFDKGRMELTDGTVTTGLLASELITGQIQLGDATFQQQAPPAIPIAGDPDNPGPTYAAFQAGAASLLRGTDEKNGAAVATVVDASGNVTASPMVAGTGPTTITAYDDATKHNVPQAFSQYRSTAGLGTIGLAISEPFLATVKVAGQQTPVMIQVFERRVLTYTASNAPESQVEMGNIGQHYYQWRYPNAAPSAAVSAAPPPLTVTSGTASKQGCRFTTTGTGLMPGTQITFNEGRGRETDPGVVRSDGTYVFSDVSEGNPQAGTLTARTVEGTFITIAYTISC